MHLTLDVALLESEHEMKILKKIYPLLLGLAAGYAYWYFIGCLNGSCPITGKWWTATMYGGLVGASWLIPSRKKTVPAPEDENTPVS
ncbi:MAG: hypothetical protein C0600_13025 [Ignavibacteria bacterium]|nr:MAG: hypothetical protein C0600_13025 [Ignavibacteria bacterium]